LTSEEKAAAAEAARKRKAAAAEAARKRKAAAAEAERKRKAEAAARQIADAQRFKDSAKSIPYNRLEKNADSFAGQPVVYRGQIFQIQESDAGGIFLMSVTNDGYGYWSDNIWVDYDHRVPYAKDDIITVWGRVVGSKSYETQIGGETYVPQVQAKFISGG